MCKRSRNRWKSILPSNGENIQGKPAAQSNYELIHVREIGEQDRRYVNVSKLERKGVTGVVLIVIRRRVIAACPHSEARNRTDTKWRCSCSRKTVLAPVGYQVDWIKTESGMLKCGLVVT